MVIFLQVLLCQSLPRLEVKYSQYFDAIQLQVQINPRNIKEKHHLVDSMTSGKTMQTNLLKFSKKKNL